MLTSLALEPKCGMQVGRRSPSNEQLADRETERIRDQVELLLYIIWKRSIYEVDQKLLELKRIPEGRLQLSNKFRDGRCTLRRKERRRCRRVERIERNGREETQSKQVHDAPQCCKFLVELGALKLAEHRTLCEHPTCQLEWGKHEEKRRAV